MADFPLFPFTTQEDWYGELQFLSADDGNAALPLAGRTFEMWITPAAQGGALIEPVRTLTMAQGGGLSFKTGGTDTLVFRVPRSAAQAFARGEYTADVLEVVDGERHLFMPVRIRYGEPSSLLSYVSRLIGISVTFLSRRQPIVTPVAIAGRQGIPGATILTGTAPPVPATGKDGDYFIEDRTASSQGRRMYGPKTGGAWPGTPWVIQVAGIADVPGLTGTLSAKADLVNGVVPVEQIPVLPTNRAVVSTGGLEDLSTSQQRSIALGTIVTTQDGLRRAYNGSGSKTDAANYTQIADITPTIPSVEGLSQKLQDQDAETAKRTLPADVRRFLTDMLGLDAAAAALLSAGLVTGAGADGLTRSLADWTRDIPVTVSSCATVLDASPAVAVQRALDRARTVIVDGDYETSGYSLRFKSGHRLVGRGDTARLIVAADPSGMSYRLPMLMLEDVRGVLVENLTIEYTYRASVPSRQYGALGRASAPGLCGGIIWRNVVFKGAPVHNEPGVENVIYDACTMDGKATITNPQPGGLVGVSNGGSRLNLATGQQESAAGAAKDILFWKCRMGNFRSEAIDCDVAWAVRILGCTIVNWGCDGTENEAIDIGGVASDGVVCRDIWIEGNTLELSHVDAQGAPVAIPGSGIHVKLGTVGAIVRNNRVRSNTATSGAGPAILFEGDGTTGEIVGNATLGFRQGVAVNNTPNGRIPVRGNTCEGMFETGIASSNGGGVTIVDNDIIGLAAGSSLSAIRILGCTDYLKGGNRISGKFNAQVTFIDANSTGCALPDLNRATAAGGPANAGTASSYAADMLLALNGLSRAGGTVTGTINHTGSYNLTGTLTNVAAASILSRHSSDANAAQSTARKSRGTATAPEVLAQNDLAGGFFSQGYTGSAYANLLTLTARAIAATPSASDMQSRLEISLNAAGATVPSLFLSGDHAGGLNLFGVTVIDASRLIRLRSYTVATLPTAGIAGRTAYASNGRAFTGAGAQEAAGAGSGVEVNDNGSAWKVAGTNATVAA